MIEDLQTIDLYEVSTHERKTRGSNAIVLRNYLNSPGLGCPHIRLGRTGLK